MFQHVSLSQSTNFWDVRVMCTVCVTHVSTKLGLSNFSILTKLWVIFIFSKFSAFTGSTVGFFIFLCQIFDSSYTSPLRVDFLHRDIFDSLLTMSWLFVIFSKWLEILPNRSLPLFFSFFFVLLSLVYLTYNEHKNRLVMSFCLGLFVIQMIRNIVCT